MSFISIKRNEKSEIVISMSEWSDNIKNRFLIFTVNIDYIFVINFWRKSIFQPQEPRNRDWEKAVNYFSFHCWISGVINDDVQTFNFLCKFRSSSSLCEGSWKVQTRLKLFWPRYVFKNLKVHSHLFFYISFTAMMCMVRQIMNTLYNW